MAANNYFYGIRGIHYIYRGDWADPELVWHKKSFNYYDLENTLWSMYQEDLQDGLPVPDFEIWIKQNAYLAREILQNLLESSCFYGGSEQ